MEKQERPRKRPSDPPTALRNLSKSYTWDALVVTVKVNGMVLDEVPHQPLLPGLDEEVVVVDGEGDAGEAAAPVLCNPLIVFNCYKESRFGAYSLFTKFRQIKSFKKTPLQ